MKSNVIVAVVLLAVVVAPAPPAQAVGVCEGTTITYDLVGIDETTGQALVKGNQEYCDEAEGDGAVEEDRGSVPFFQVRRLNGKGKTTWFLPRNDSRTRSRFTGIRLPKKPQSFKALEALRNKQTFTPVDKLAASPSGACSSAVTTKDLREVEREFRKTVVTVSIHARGKRLWSKKLGRAAIDGGPEVKAFWSQKRRSLVLWADLPSCGGPPPGFFEGDSGDCYPEHAPFLVERRAAQSRKLGVCFKTKNGPTK